MPVSREEQMLELLKALKAEAPAVESVVVVSSDALPLGSDLGGPLDEDAMCRAVSGLIAATERASADLDRGDLQRVYVRADSGYIVVFQVNRDISLACTVMVGAAMEETLARISLCARKLSEVI